MPTNATPGSRGPRRARLRPLVLAILLLAPALAASPAGAQVIQFGGVLVHLELPDGEPARATPVELWSDADGRRAASSMTNGTGVASFTVAPGSYEVRVKLATDLRLDGVVVEAGEATEVVVPVGAVEVAILTATGPAAGEVRILSGSRTVATTQVTATRLGVVPLAPGEYTARVTRGNDLDVPFVVEAGNRTSVSVTFARLAVAVHGGNGLGESGVEVKVTHAQNRRMSPADGRTNATGVHGVDLAPGSYRVQVGGRDLGTFEVEAGNETVVRDDVGVLLGYARSEGQWIPGELVVTPAGVKKPEWRSPIGGQGVGTLLLAPGQYDVTLRSSARVATYFDFTVRAHEIVRIGDYANHNPVIQQVTITPPRVDPGETASVRVTARDVDRDNVSIVHRVDAGMIEGSGESVTYHATTGAVTDKITIDVFDDAGGFASRDVYVANVSGTLDLKILGVDNAPLRGTRITVFDEHSGREVASGVTNSTGDARFQLLIGLYRVRATASGDLWIDHVLVPRSGASFIVGGDASEKPPVVTSSSPADTLVRARAGGAVEFSVDARDPTGGEPQYRWLVDDEYQASTPAFTYRPPADSEGNHTVRAVITNGQAAATREWRVEVTRENQPPRIVSVGASRTTVAPGESVTLSVAAVDPDGDPITIAWTGRQGTLVNGTETNPVWTAAHVETSRDVEIRVQVSDGNETSAARVTLRIEVPPAPAVQEIEEEFEFEEEAPPRERVPGPQALAVLGAVGAAWFLARRRAR